MNSIQPSSCVKVEVYDHGYVTLNIMKLVPHARNLRLPIVVALCFVMPVICTKLCCRLA